MALKSKIGFHALALMLKGGLILATILNCESPQYIVLGTEGNVDCSFPNEFTAIVWYDSSNIGEAHVTRLEKQKNGVLKASGDGYESGKYDILLNGTLIIPLVTIHHEGNFTVLLVDKDLTVSEKDIALVTVVPLDQSIPEISSCETTRLCLTSSMQNEELMCTLKNARPAVSLTWYLQNEKGMEVINAQTNMTIDGQYTFTSTSTVTVSKFISNPLTLLSCRASGPAVGLGQPTTNIIVYNSDTNSQESRNINVLERTVFFNASLEIPCIESQKPMAFVWSFERHNASRTLAFSALGERKVIDNVNHTVDVLLDGTILFENVDYQLEGVFICTYIASGKSSSFTMIKVKVIAEDNGASKAIAIVTVLLIVVFIVSGIAYYVMKKMMVRPLDVYRNSANALLSYPLACGSNEEIFSKEAIKLLRQVGKEADSNRKANNYASAAGAGTSAGGGVAALVGTCLLPFTLGASVLLIGVGVVAGVAGASVSAGFAIDRIRKDKKRLNRVKPHFERFVKVQECLSKTVIYIAIAYEVIDFFQTEQSKRTDEILKKLLQEIKAEKDNTQTPMHSGAETVQKKIENVMKKAKGLVNTTLYFLKERNDSPLTSAVEKWKKKIKEAEKFPFNLLREAVIKVIACGEFRENIFTFSAIIQRIYASELISSTGGEICTAAVVGNAAVSSAATTARAVTQVINVGDDVAKVSLNVAKVAQGVAVAGLVLGLVGIAVDVAFLGKAFIDIKKNEKEQLVQSLEETANLMETMNGLLIKKETV